MAHFRIDIRGETVANEETPEVGGLVRIFTNAGGEMYHEVVLYFSEKHGLSLELDGEVYKTISRTAVDASRP